jgi:phosphomethylpyrimidine synthase
MDAAKQGILTDAMLAVAQREGIEAEALREMVARGTAVVPANVRHTKLEPRGIGRTLSTKINVNIGISRDSGDLNAETEKAEIAVALGADAIMDLSTSGDTGTFRKKLVDSSPVMLGTVPAYDALVRFGKPLKEITATQWIEVVGDHAKDGIDFQTIHAGISRSMLADIKSGKRTTGVVSRGGSLIFAWMEATGRENPFLEYFDDILEIFRTYDVTLSLGDGLRPGSIADSTDYFQISELLALGRLAERARARDVQVIIEGPGHMGMDEISANMTLERKLCGDAPFYVLGPVVTDIAPGYDHITSAIGGAIAAASGAAFLCYVTPAEHLRLPSLEDMKEGIIASRIAAHAADIAKGIPRARERDNRMSEARRALDWETMFSLALDPIKAREYRKSSTPSEDDSCTMCGKMCAIRSINRLMNGEEADVI